jgi:gliding motility-associated-like protein
VKPLTKFHVYKMKLEGANSAPEIVGQKRQANYYNYFLGNDQSKWKSDIHPFLALDYKQVYRGIDMHVTSESGSPVYEFIVSPGAEASQVKLSFEGPEKMSINKSGDLVINTSVGNVMEMKPYAYQYIDDEKVEVPCYYHLKNNVVTYNLPRDYDHSKTLIIDPIILWASFTGSTADNWGFTATYDNSGNFYMGGIVNCLAMAGGGTFPVSPGAYQLTWGGGTQTAVAGIEWASDIALMKLSSDGTTRIYSTYLGGAFNERPHSMIVDNDGNLIVAGKTRSTNYPVTSGAYQGTNAGGWDIVVTKLNATGTALVGSSYLGGTGNDGVNFDSTEYIYGHLKYNYGDDARSEVQVDNLGNIYVAGCTQSGNFPTTPTAIATTLAGMQDGVIFKMNSTLSSLLWSTYLKGANDDAGYVLGFNKLQSSVYVAGGTNSLDFPVTPGTWQTTYQGDSADGFILKFQNSSPYNLQAGTFVGTSNVDQIFGLQVDDSDHVYVMGQSLGGTFPVTAGVHSNPNSCQFIMKMDKNLTTDLISTVYGSGDPLHVNISPVAFLVDTCGNVYVSGWGGDIIGSSPVLAAHTGTTFGMETTPGCHQATTDGFDFYFIVFGGGMGGLRYATFYGRNAPGGRGEHVDGGTSRFSKQGTIYQGICANCGGSAPPPFPTTSGVWAPVSASSNCNQAALKIAFNIGPVHCDITAGPSTSGGAPLTVNFFNTTTNGLSFLWDFGDGSPTTTAFTASHTFTAAGTYTVTLSAANSNACFKTDDTARIVIVVDTNSIKPSFIYKVTDSCGPYAAEFTNTSTTNITTGAPTYNWSFGDGTTFAGQNPPKHNYPDTGCYTVTLVMAHPNACKSPDTVTKVVCIRGFRVSLNYTIPDSLCAGVAFTPTGSGTSGSTITWSYGDGKAGSGTPPPQLYSAGGTYTVTFVITNPGSCNISDSVKKVIKIIPGPTADFSFSPTLPETNVPTKYTNLSRNAIKYAWDFGDGETSAETNPTHQFKRTGSYKTCLTAFNSYNCPSVICKQVPAEIEPIIGLPTGFSPNGDGSNDILYVRGAAIRTLDLKIYNRWGQLVFHTTNQAIGWDGTFNGQPQPIEAYAYVLNVTFIDDSSKLLKGNITLLR